MRIGLLVTSMGNFGQKGFYNAQEVGLAKALASFPLVKEVKVYKLVDQSQEQSVETIEGHPNATIAFIPAKGFGINGKINTKVLDKTLDALVYFSDTQFSVPAVYRWTKKNGVKFLPYIGVIESHSTSQLKKKIVDFMFGRNLNIYKKCSCIVKTPDVQQQLKEIGVYKTDVAPVGLDLTLLKKEYDTIQISELKKKYGYQEEDKVLLFIGRLIEEKQPVRMIELFAEILKKEPSYKLLMVGTGALKDTILEKIANYSIKEQVKLIDRISNQDIWELYRLADAFVNLNQQEIFGMAILEAMYYGCKVVAWEAPGPSFVIESGRSGWIVSNNQQVIDKIMDQTDVVQNAHQRICEKFTWKTTAEKILEKVRE